MRGPDGLIVDADIVHIRVDDGQKTACGKPNYGVRTCLRMNSRISCERCIAVARRNRWPGAVPHP